MVEVQSSLRLTGNSYINCYTYDDHAPILGIDDAHVKVSITVPDTSEVTADDVTWARLLAAVGDPVRDRAGKARCRPATPADPDGQAA